MNICRQDEKDISKVFVVLRSQLQVKEKELLELQRQDPCLLAPNSEQIEMLLDTIASLQLSTLDGSFIFASSSMDDDGDCSSCTSVCSTDFNSIKNLPSTVWLPQSRPPVQHNEQRLSIFSHLLSLPISAYLASSLPSFQRNPKPSNYRIPTFNHLLFMPIDAFKSSSNTCTSNEMKNNKNLRVNILSITETNKSLLNNNMIYSKEYWLQNNHNPTPKCEVFSCT